MSLLAVNPGAYYHLESFESPRYREYFNQLVRPEDLGDVDLQAFDTILIPCRTPANRMIPHAPRLAAFLAQGGTVVATGESRSDLWLPGFRFHAQATNYWWWREAQGDLGIQITNPAHAIFNYLTPESLTWHLHGWFDLAEGADVIASNAEGKPILAIDTVTTRGRMVLTTLDPFYHHGSHFMPATTWFLDGFLPWIASLRSDNGNGV
ncbi:MAG TPA: hypothetical protein DD979_01765 [Gammaproteobacteria bacterium]|nr:hypothetical protein [Gammaproteobacteria bacterium]